MAGGRLSPVRAYPLKSTEDGDGMPNNDEDTGRDCGRGRKIQESDESNEVQ